MFDLLEGATFDEVDRVSLIDALANKDIVTARNASRIKHNTTQKCEICYQVLTEEAWHMLRLGDFCENCKHL